MRGIKTNVLTFPGIQVILCCSDDHFFVAVTQMHFVDCISMCELYSDFSFLEESGLVAFFNVDIDSLVLGQH